MPRLETIQRMFARFERISDWRLFALCVVWVLFGGLMLQLVVLPYLVPFAHWGHGLIADQDSIGYHVAAVEMSERIRQQGWHTWAVTRENSWVDLISALYAVTYPEPWVVLPLNGIMFGTVVVAVRRLLAVIFDSQVRALLAVAPFFLFPSFVPIWGQLQKDLGTGAGFSLVLGALVLAGNRSRGSVGAFACTLMAVAGVGLIWVFRFYALSLIAAATVVFVAVTWFHRGCQRARLSVVGITVIVAAVASLAGWTRPRTPYMNELARGPASPVTVAAKPRPVTAPSSPVPPPGSPVAPPPPSAAPSSPAPPLGSPVVPPPPSAARTPTVALAWRSWLPHVRKVDASLPRYANCLPEPTTDISDRLLFNLCHVREGYVLDAIGAKAGSGYGYDIRLRSAQDFVAYVPWALEAALFEPGPARWRTERTTIGRLGSAFIPFEMIVAYAIVLLTAIFARRWLARVDIWGVVAFCLTYTIFYVFGVPQIGTLYRMRAVPFAIILSTGLAILFSRWKEAEPF